MKLSTGVLVALLVTVILLPGESALMYALKGLVCIGCALALVRQPPAGGKAEKNTLHVLAGLLCGALIAILTLA